MKYVGVCCPSPLHDSFHLTVFSYADTLWFWTHKPWGHNSFLVIRASINNGSNSPSSNTDFLWPTGSDSVECQGYPSAPASGSTLDSAQIRRTPSTWQCSCESIHPSNSLISLNLDKILSDWEPWGCLHFVLP